MEKIKNGKVFTWMQLLGFERDDPDRGAERFMNQTGFVPDGACALLFHPDFIHHHRGMAEEYELYPDNCSYFGIPGNIERQRQPWTNYNLRELAHNLKSQGTGLYAGVMGSVTNNALHQEWQSEHPEIKGAWGHCLLKRFKDGNWYEDFFADKLCETLTDYGFSGIHIADCFCPNGNLNNGDFSADMITQFTSHTGIILPPEITAALGDESGESYDIRQKYIWKNLRADWIEFFCWRWEQFFIKICARVHEIGCEVMTLGMYCTDPFETKYCLGTDLARIMKAGVDYLTANILPTSCYMAIPWDAEYYFHRYMAIAPTTAAHIKDGSLISMVGLQDATEEWDIMRHFPVLHDRDLYTMAAYQLADGNGIKRALEGYFLCLCDGIPRSDWDVERKKIEIALSADVESVLSPSMLWSDYAYENMLKEYIKTRRWTPFKLFYEMSKAGVMCGACITSGALADYFGTLLIPDFDMLSEEEKSAVAQYKNGGVVCTAPAGYDFAAYNIKPAVYIADRFSKHPMCAIAFGAEIPQEAKDKIEKLLSADDGKPDLEGDPADAPEFSQTLYDTLPFVKVTAGFRDAAALLLKEAQNGMIACDMPYMAFKLQNGSWRLYIYNNDDRKYRHAFVEIETGRKVSDVRVISNFPILPVRYIDKKDGNLIHYHNKDAVNKQNFEVKLQPGGVTILDVVF